jgi:glycosyltransferase involved in cell wall biosynthesis
MADVATENGISKKIQTQTNVWLGSGHEVRYFAVAASAEVWPGLAFLHAEVLGRTNPAGRVAQSFRLARRIRAWKPDLVYFRYAHHSPGFSGLFRAIPAIAEINSDDTIEYALTLSRTKRLYHRLTRGRILRCVRGFVPVTRELAVRFAHFGKPAEVIGNSIDLANFRLLPPPDPAKPQGLVFVGSPGSPWHGLVRVGELAALFPCCRFDVIGCTPSGWREAGAGDAPPNVRLHGPLMREHYEPLIQEATVAIGTLGLFRKRMDEACPLKVREYLAHGLPVIGAYEDTDIAPAADYFLRLPNDSAPLGPWRDRIAAFIDHWGTRRVPRCAIAHLDVSVKEAKRLAFMEGILCGSRR